MVNTRPSVLVSDDFDEAHRFREIVTQYRQHLRARGLSDGTIAQRIIHLKVLQDAHPDVRAVTTADMERILARRRTTHSAESRRSLRSSWLVFFKWATRAGYVGENPALDVAPVRLPRAVARIADDDDIRDALTVASTVETAMVLLGRLGGLRVSEIARAHTRDREGDVLRVLGKGGHVRVVPLNAQLAESLDRLEAIQGEGPYFRNSQTGEPLHVQSVGKIIHKVTGWNPHSLRHAAATAAYGGTGDLRAVQELLGHTSLATTQRYLHVRADQVRAAADATMLGAPRNRFAPGGDHG